MAQNITPAVSVVMSAYNAQAYIGAAVDSILKQTFTDFEFIIVDDGSTDKTPRILRRYHDPRLQVISQANQGLVASLNEAIKLAKAPLVARQDADDASEPSRLQQQFDLLSRQLELVIVGSSIEVMDESGRRSHKHFVLIGDPELKQELLVRSPFAHGSVMFRKTAFERAGGYRSSEWPAEDYGLWLRMAGAGRFANIDEPLYIYREAGYGTSTQYQALQLARRDRIRQKAWKQRRSLASPTKINSAAYLSLDMGQLRVERIAHNLLFELRKSLLALSLPGTLQTLGFLLLDAHLRRKCARLILIKFGFKHA